MEITQQPYKHLKLDKFVYGSKQKIIKTTTQIVTKENEKLTVYNSNKKNVYYFSDIDKNLLDFHQINFDYINNKKGKISINSYIDNNNPTFSISANIIKHYTTEQDGQRITYFPEYLYTPLDITQFKNSCYFLLPISTNKFVNIAHPNKILNDIENFQQNPVPENIASNIKPHIQFYDRAAYTSEDNSIPVYDMNFKQIETVKFSSSTELYNWLLKWNLQSIIYQDNDGTYHSLINQILFDSSQNMSFIQLINKDLSIENCDSVIIEPFINYLINKRYLYSRDTINNILSELFANLSTSSTQRYFKLAGKINTLNDSITTGSIFNNIEKNLKEEGIYNTYDLINQKQSITFDPTVLPQNTLLIDNIKDSLIYAEDKDLREYFPSCYTNFVNLKNNRDPQYQLNCTIDNIKITNDIFTSDKRFSIEYNKPQNSLQHLSSVNEQLTLEITNKAVKYDNNLTNNAGYTNLFPKRMSTKQQYYLNQYDNKHICENTLYSMGTLNGIRNYIHVGTSFNKNIWLSYSYNEKNTNYIEIYNEIYNYYLNNEKYNLKYELSNKTTGIITSFYLLDNRNIKYYIDYSDIFNKFYPNNSTDPIKIIKTIDNNIYFAHIKNAKTYTLLKDQNNQICYFNEDGEKFFLNNKEGQYFIESEDNYYINSQNISSGKVTVDIILSTKFIFNDKEINLQNSSSFIKTKDGIQIILNNQNFVLNGNTIEDSIEKISSTKYKNYSLPFGAYSLDRDSQWLKDYNENNIKDVLTKSKNFECPWSKTIQRNVIGCPLADSKECNGYCTFPCNGKIKELKDEKWGLNWKLNQYKDLNKDTEINLDNLNLTNNNEWFIISPIEQEQLIIADSDILINDDLEVFVTSTSILNNGELSDLTSLITLQQELKSIFQGFWNKGQYQEYRYTDDEYQIAPNSKFNGPHIITKDTIITAYDLDNNKTVKIIPKNCNILMRVKSWWSDTIRCEGNIKVIQNTEDTLITNIENYDFIQTVDGFFKFRQTGLHKSNIYSINLKNTGLDRSGDKVVKYYTKKEVIKLIEQKYNIRYYQDEDSFLVNNEQNAFIHAVFDSEWNTTYKRTPLFKNLEHNNLSGFILNYIIVPFQTMIQQEKMDKEINDQFEEVYFYKKQKYEAEEYNETRQNIRQLIQKAIRKSIIRYMPADTNLWKVEYQDEN